MSNQQNSSEAPVALVTGGGSGIGRATAVHFAKAGCHVVAADIDKAGADGTCALIRESGANGDCLAVECDITDPQSVVNLIDAIKDKFGRLDYAFNNAGIAGNAAPIHELPLQEWDRVMSVNLRGHFIAMQAQIPLMLQTSTAPGGPAIVITSSICGHQAHPGMSAYTSSKFAVRGLVKAAAVEYGPRGLRVNSVSPGGVSTPLLMNFLASESGAAVVGQLIKDGATLQNDINAQPKTISKQGATASSAAPVATGLEDSNMTPAEAPAGRIDVDDSLGGAESEATPNTLPLRRVGQPDDIASAVVWLCIHGHYVTGTDLLVDGGSMCRCAS